MKKAKTRLGVSMKQLLSPKKSKKWFYAKWFGGQEKSRREFKE